MRCEPGVSGRLLEVYDDTTGDALELARITTWEPGRRLAWRSSIDDVEIDVSFDASPAGAKVELICTGVWAHRLVPESASRPGHAAWTSTSP
jgi:hypothetical protein